MYPEGALANDAADLLDSSLAGIQLLQCTSCVEATGGDGEADGLEEFLVFRIKRTIDEYVAVSGRIEVVETQGPCEFGMRASLPGLSPRWKTCSYKAIWD